ncbi:hypothetical protein WL34_04000 [Burkholderia cepacia]|nr:hypothetical protein WL34_04000 [Burkholderia cepacia]
MRGAEDFRDGRTNRPESRGRCHPPTPGLRSRPACVRARPAFARGLRSRAAGSRTGHARACPARCVPLARGGPFLRGPPRAAGMPAIRSGQVRLGRAAGMVGTGQSRIWP